MSTTDTKTNKQSYGNCYTGFINMSDTYGTERMFESLRHTMYGDMDNQAEKAQGKYYDAKM